MNNEQFDENDAVDEIIEPIIGITYICSRTNRRYHYDALLQMETTEARVSSAIGYALWL